MLEIKQKLIIAILLVGLPGLTHALGLGKIRTSSGLNEPLEARIELLSPTRDELDSLTINLASQEAFRRAGIERGLVLSKLKFGIKETDSGPDFIRVYSTEPIREPFLNFLLEVSWSKGRIFREYTVLLDPPIYEPIIREESTVHPRSPVIESVDKDHTVVYDPTYQQEIRPSVTTTPRTINYTGGDYGPTVTGDTLWSLASAMRPDNSISIQQMMFALLRANPEAFINGNINGLKRGEILHMPDLAEIQSLSKAEAFEQTKLQNNTWDADRYPITETVPVRPEQATEEITAVEPIQEAPAEVTEEPTATTQAEVVEMVDEGEPELRLVAPEEGMKGDETATDAAMGDADSGAIAGELALANESIEALKLENAELGDKLAEADGLITDLQRYIELKENELNLLQEQVRIAAAETEEPVMPADKMEEEMAEESTPDETMTEEVDTGEEEMAEETAEEPEESVEEVAAADESEAAPVAAPSIVDTILGQVMGIVDLIKQNSMMVAAAAGGLLLVISGALFAMRRRGDKAEVVDIPTADDFPDFEDMAEGSEDETDINAALADDDAEAVTELPEADEEPDFDLGASADEKTQVVAPSSAQPEEEEEDPMAEVNVFLAYEHFDQAEDFVRQAIEKDPENVDFHSKLLEVFYAAGNRKSYEQAARVLHDKVGGQGDHWEMAVAMWQELSPNRALFAEPSADEEADEVGSSSGGIVDITGDEEQTAGSDEEMLDVTAAMNLDEEDIASPEDDGGLDFTPAESEAETLGSGIGSDDEEVLDITSADDEEEIEASADDEDMLDVTAAVGLDEELEEAEEEVSSADDGGLDFSFGDEAASEEEPEEEAGSADDGGLDFSFGDEAASEEETLGATEAGDDILDLTMEAGEAVEASSPEDDALSLSDSSDDVLDLTMDAGEESGSEDDALSLSDSSDDVLDLTMDAGEESGSEDDALSLSDAGDDLLDLTAGSSVSDDNNELDEDVLDVSKSHADDLLDVTTSAKFEPESADEDLLDVTTASSPDGVTVGGNALLDSDNNGEDDVLDLTAESDSGGAEEKGEGLEFDIGLDVSSPPTGEIPVEGLDLDLDLQGDGEEDSGGLVIDMDNTVEIPESALPKMEPKKPPKEEPEIDMEATVQAPASLNLSLDDEPDEEEGGDETVLVKRSSDTPEQSAEDEIGTQLDLAKAYIELGDNDNAKTILDEVMALGNEEQKQQAQELLGQI